MSLRLRSLLVASVAVFLQFPAIAEDAKIPTGAKIELVADRIEFFLGENILLYYRITNTGETSFSIDVGGDYRGGTRANRFKITAVDADNRSVEDPSPKQFHMGGLSPIANLEPGEVWYENVPVLRYTKLEKPGEYKLEVYHDLGFGDRGDNDPRTKSIRLKLQEPNETDALKIIATMQDLRNYSGDSWGKKGRGNADFTLLTHPVYLPLIERQGDSDAVTALSHMPGAEATQALMRLTSRDDDLTAAMAGLAISARISPASGLPGNQTLGAPWFPQGRPPIIAESWRPEFTAPVRALAHKLIGRTDDLALIAAASLLMQVGNDKDFKTLLASLDPVIKRAVAPATNKDHHEGPRWALRQTLIAFEHFASRGILLEAAPESTAEYLAFTATLSADPKPGFEKTLAAVLQHPHPLVREVAVRRLPAPLPPPLPTHVLALMADADAKVRSAACEVANNLKLPGGRKQALQAIAKSQDPWTVWMAVDTAVRDGGRVECAKLLADRFAELSDHPQYVSMHIMRHLCRITTGGHMSGSWHFLKDPDGKKRARAIGDAWKKMIDEHADDLRAGKLVTFTDDKLPADLGEF
ncbi:MAG: hypothetical protein ACI8XO_001748 [Verrucomicrobiales bacterium]|jgi:hypothetical protein